MKNIRLLILVFALCVSGVEIFTGPAASRVYGVNRDYGLNAASVTAMLYCMGCDHRVVNQFLDRCSTKRPYLGYNGSPVDETGTELTECQYLDLDSKGPRVTVEPDEKGGWRTVFIKDNTN